MRFTILLIALSLSACSPSGRNNDAAAPTDSRDAGRSVERPSFVLAIPDVPTGHHVTITEEETGGTTTTTESGKAIGAGAKAVGDKLSDSFTGSAPAIGLGGGVSGMGGGSIRSVQVEKLATAMSNPLLWAGILCILAAGAALYFGIRRAAVIAGACGAGLIVAAMLPAWAWFIVAGCAVIGGGVYLYAEHKGMRAKEALRAVVAGVDGLDEQSKAAAKAEVAKHADEKDKAVIKAIKKADDLGLEK